MSKHHQDSATLIASETRAGDALPPEFLKKKKKEEDSKKDARGAKGAKDAVITAGKGKKVPLFKGKK